MKPRFRPMNAMFDAPLRDKHGFSVSSSDFFLN
jgi:hypothetical protein